MTSIEAREFPATPELCLPPALRKPRLRRWEASQYVELVHGIIIAPATLAKMASVGGGPAYNKANRTPLYPKEELDRWAIERLGRLVRNSSEADVQAAEKLSAPVRSASGASVRGVGACTLPCGDNSTSGAGLRAAE